MITLTEKKELLFLLEQKQKVKAKKNLLDFTIFTKPNFVPNWFHTKYYNVLNDFANGNIKKLMVFVPPQHGKSEGSTRRLPAYMIGKVPDKRIAIVSYSASKARKFNREIQRVIEDPTYTEIFPQIQLSNGSDGFAKTFDEFEIVGHEGSIKTVGVGGPLTGEPVDMLIMDDLYKDWASAQSTTIRESIQDWYDSVADTRLHNESQQLIVFTRWHQMDLAGYLLSKEKEDWTVLIYPAIKIDEPNSYDPRKPGEPLWPQKHNLEKLRKTQSRNPHNFESLYQQNAKPKEGLLFPEDELKLYDPSKIDLNKLTEFAYMQIDAADQGGDYYAAPICLLVENKIYIPEVIFSKDGTETTEPETVDLASHYKLNAMQFEGNGGWVSMGKSIRATLSEKLPECEYRIIKNHVNKQTRILAQASFIRRNIYFRNDYKNIPAYQSFIANLTGYLKEGKNDNDDSPDVLAGVSKYFNDNFNHLFS